MGYSGVSTSYTLQVSPLYDPPGTPYTVYFPTLTDDGFSGINSSRPVWIQGIEATPDTLVYPYNITAAWFGLSGFDWQPVMTVRSDPNFIPASPSESVYLQYTIYYLYQ